MKFLTAFILSLSLTIVAPTALGQRSPDFKTESVFDKYRVRHVVFNSTFVQPEVAKIYQIKRSKYESILNVSLSKLTEDGSLPAAITGTVTNLMQQQKNLVFQEISEENATYYIAPVRIANEELLRFELRVIPQLDSEQVPLTVKFSQTVYADE